MNTAEVYLLLMSPSGTRVNGEVQAFQYEKQIALSNWSWGIGAKEKNGAKSGEVHVKGRKFVITKPTDLSSSTLMSYLADGSKCEKATISVLQRQEVSIAMRVALRGVRFMKLTHDIKENDEQEVDVVETWTLSYDAVEVYYKGERSKQDVSGHVKNSELASTGFFEWQRPPGEKNAATASGGLDFDDDLFDSSDEDFDVNVDDLDGDDDSELFGFQ